MVAGLNIVAAGGTQAGKISLLSCLAAAIPGGERVISAEEVFELRFNRPMCDIGAGRAGRTSLSAADERTHGAAPLRTACLRCDAAPETTAVPLRASLERLP